MKRRFWIAFGAASQVLFFFTVYQIFAFLYRDSGDLLGIEPLPFDWAASWPGLAGLSVEWRVALDVLLLFQFGLTHSFFLYPAVRRQIERFIPDALYGALYGVIAETSILITIIFWQPLPGVVYHATGISAWILEIGFLGSWVALLYSIRLTGFGFQTGFTPWWAYVRGQESPRRDFLTTGAYRFLRHPIYLSFLGLIWFTPRMMSDHLLMASIWTMYVYIGSVLKDRRLLYFVGDRYRTYMARVPGYPGIPWGPLARSRRS